VAVVYMLRNGDEDLFKVGWGRSIEERLRDHHTSNPHLTVFEVIEAGSNAAATSCEAYLKGVLQSRRHPSAGSTREFFALTTAEAEDAARDARTYLAEDFPMKGKADLLAVEACDGRILVPGDAEWDAFRRLLPVCEENYRTGAEKARLENQLKLAIGTAEALDGVATWRSHTRTKFDEAWFKSEQPDVWRAFRRESRTRRFELQ